MPIAKLESGVELSYSDSGVPNNSSSYDTVIICHGVGFNKEAFSPLFPYAAQNNLRIIPYNQRGYADSTPLTPSQLEMTTEDSIPQSVDFVRDLIGFISYVNTTLVVPSKPVIIGWSKGTALLIGLASPGFLPADEQKAALSTFSKLVLYEPPGSVFGLPLTKDYTDAMSTVITGNDKNSLNDNFGNWISGFYEPGETKPYATSLTTLPAEYLASANEPHMVKHGFYWKLALSADDQYEVTKSALLNDNVKIGVCRNGKTAGYLVAAADAAAALGATTKVLDEGGNHFAFAHEPEKWLGQIWKFATEL
ncbi:Alpha/Beta hydrolase protein [Myxozyma melibiosi]|uniref:Alpha/Beta hydrolase protein n=1 Tax=Myxozyma melibiosi TaxID=54550 RepID=A0ABR1F517_9ASCO